jgi:hypothetical protein
MVTKKTERILISIPVPQVRDFIQPTPTVHPRSFLEPGLRTTHPPGGGEMGCFVRWFVCVCPLVHVFVRWCVYIYRWRFPTLEST